MSTFTLSSVCLLNPLISQVHPLTKILNNIMWASTDVWLHGVYFRRGFFFFRIKGQDIREMSSGAGKGLHWWNMQYFLFFLCELSSAASATFSTVHPAGFLPTPEERGSTKDPHFLQAPLLFQLPSRLAASPKTYTLPNIFLMNILFMKCLQIFTRFDFVHLKRCSSRKCKLACLFLITS